MQTATEVTKAVIMARGLGTRMRRTATDVRVSSEQSAVADMGLKTMIPIGQWPFLDYVLSGLADAGFSDVCLVVAPEHDAIRHYYTVTCKPVRLRLHFAIQQKALGTADAVLAAEQFVGADEFAVLNSDNYYPVEALHALQQLGGPGTVLFEEKALIHNSNIPAERIRSFAYGLVDRKGDLSELVEKPDAAAAARLRQEGLVSMNLWRFSPTIFDACRAVQLSPRGELELTTAIRKLIQEGLPLKVLRCNAGVLDLSQRADIPEVVARLANMKVSL